ncbi:MAG: L-threonylcarbamoyladenylate synthase [Halioglobus sp.]
MPQSLSTIALRQAVTAIRSGGVVACPTEAVWGLSCDPFNEMAVARLLYLKRREMAKGLVLVAGSESQLEWLLRGLPLAQQARLSLSWPGPTTWLVPHQHRVPGWICGDHDTVAVRVSAHPLVRALCNAWGGPLVSTSANPAGSRPATQSFQVRRYFGTDLDYIISGALGGASRPTVIKHLLTDEIIRA